MPLGLALFSTRCLTVAVWDQTPTQGVIWELVIFFFCYMQPHFYHFCKGLYQNLLNFVGIDVKCPCRASCEGDDGEEGFLSPNAYKGFRPRVCTKGEPCSSSSFRL